MYVADTKPWVDAVKSHLVNVYTKLHVLVWRSAVELFDQIDLHCYQLSLCPHPAISYIS